MRECGGMSLEQAATSVGRGAKPLNLVRRNRTAEALQLQVTDRSRIDLHFSRSEGTWSDENLAAHRARVKCPLHEHAGMSPGTTFRVRPDLVEDRHLP